MYIYISHEMAYRSRQYTSSIRGVCAHMICYVWASTIYKWIRKRHWHVEVMVPRGTSECAQRPKLWWKRALVNGLHGISEGCIFMKWHALYCLYAPCALIDTPWTATLYVQPPCTHSRFGNVCVCVPVRLHYNPFSRTTFAWFRSGVLGSHLPMWFEFWFGTHRGGGVDIYGVICIG